MLSLQVIDDKFEIMFTVIDNGSGQFRGIIDEISQTQAPSYVFSPPRRILRVKPGSLVDSAMVIRSAGGTNYLVGEHGDSETHEGKVFKSFRLFETHTLYPVKRLETLVEPITNLPSREEPVTVATIWGTYEPLPEIFDRELRVPAESARFITNYHLERQDIVDGKQVVRVDQQLGLYIAILI